MGDATEQDGTSDEKMRVREMMDEINMPLRGPSIALAWLSFVLAAAGCAVTFFPWIGMSLAVSKGLVPEGAAAFRWWGDPIMIGSLVTVLATFALAIVSPFRSIGTRLLSAAFVMALFWPLAMQVLRIYMYDIAR